MNSLYGFRKIAATLVVLGIASVLVIYHGDVPPGMQEVLQWVFTAFVAGNGVEHISDALSSQSTAAPDGANAQVAATLAVFAQKLDSVGGSIASIEHSDAEAKASLALIVDTLSMIIRKTGVDKMPDKAS